jgi:hypothetical protein
VEIEAGDTEGECTRRVASTASTASLSVYFQQLTRAWLGLAYAQSPPSATTWDNLCAAWPFQNPIKPNRSSATGTAMLLLACALLSGCGGRFEDSEETTGYKGEARFNPYLAVTRLNDEFDLSTRTSFSLLKELAQHDGYTSSQWVVTPSLLVNEHAAEKLLDRVADGDHLVMALSELFYYEEMGAKPPQWVSDKKSIAEDENARRKRWREKQLADHDDEENPFADFKKKEPTFDSTGVRLRKHLEKFTPGAAMVMKEAGVRFADEVDEDRVDEESFGSRDWDWPAAFIFSNGSEDTPAQRVMTIEYGDGRITFLPSMRPFTNLRLANDRNASLWHSLVDWHGGEVFFIRGSGTSFLAILWEYGWRALIALLVALALWLWAVTKRFGRLPARRVPPPLDAKAGLVATGSFLLRKKQVPALLAPWAESLYSRWKRNQPAEPEPTQARFLAQVAAEAGLSEQEAAECFSPSERTRSRKFLSLAKRLWQLGRTF